MKDLFGVEIVSPFPSKEKNYNSAKGNPAPIGSGPKGEFCKTCANFRRKGRFFKCNLVKPTCGPGTDIRAGWEACSLWKPL